MSLLERLKAKQIKTETVSLDGETVKVVGMSKSERGEVFAACRNRKGKLDNEKLEGLMLARCLRDPETGERIATDDQWKEFDSMPAHVTAPAVASVMRVCGLDQQDLGDPKDSDSTES